MSRGGRALAPEETLCAQRIKLARRAEQRMRRQVSAALAEGDERRVRSLIRMYLLSFDARLAALHFENQRRDWSGRKLASGVYGEDRRISCTQVVSLAGRLDMFAPSTEPVRVKQVTKRNGKFRDVYVYGLEQKARQRVWWRVLMILASRKLIPWQFLLVGRHAALRAVANAAEARDHRFAAELDVTNQFGSFDIRAVAEFLPELPAKGVGANLVPTRVSFDHRRLSSIPEDHTYRNQMPQQGLPQGAATSPVVAEMLMARVLMALPWEMLSDVTIITYADNILVLGPTKASVLDACECLSDAFAGSAVGSMRLESRGVKSLRNGVEFLGMKVARERQRVVMTVPARKRRSLVRALHSDWREHRSAPRLEAKVRSHLAAEALDTRAAFSAALVTQALVQQGATVAELDAIERYARRSTAGRQRGLSLSAVMLDAPSGRGVRAIERDLRQRGIGP